VIHQVGHLGKCCLDVECNLDATVGYTFKQHIKLNAGLFNITNVQQFNSASLAGFASTNTQIPLYANPGRYVGVNLTARW